MACLKWPNNMNFQQHRHTGISTFLYS
uniref:Uncharacterized protein n=1 Tax=Anguilla anguilla TaxID=7936 RepID=A0A0E9VCG0_ANGAN